MDVSKLPFSLFDFFAIFFPGAIGTFGFYLFLYPELDEFEALVKNIPLTILLIVISYLAGHVLYAASEILIDRFANVLEGSIVGEYLTRIGLAKKIRKPKNSPSIISVDWNPDIRFVWRDEFSSDSKYDRQFGSLIMKCLVNEFGGLPGQINHTFQLVLVYAQKNTKGEYNEVPAFAAIETMFQSLVLATVILFFGFLRRFISVFNPSTIIIISLIILLLIALFYYCYRRYKRMWVETIFSQFVVASMAKNTPLTQSNKSESK